MPANKTPAETELAKLIEARGRALEGRWSTESDGRRLTLGTTADPNRPGLEPIARKFTFDNDARFCAVAANWVSDHAPTLLQQHEQDRARMERLEKAIEYEINTTEDGSLSARLVHALAEGAR